MKTVSKASLQELKSYINEMMNRAMDLSLTCGNEAWKQLHDIIFSNDFIGIIYDRFPDFIFYYADISYEEDVTDFIYEFNNYLEGKIGNTDNNEIMSFEDWII